jgi:hypothetical protein
MLNHPKLLTELHHQLKECLSNDNISKIKKNYFIINKSYKLKIATEYEIDKQNRMLYIEVQLRSNLQKLKFSTVNNFVQWFNINKCLVMQA